MKVTMSAASVQNNLSLFIVHSSRVEDLAQALFRKVATWAYQSFYGDYHNGTAALDFVKFMQYVESSLDDQEEMCCVISINRGGWLTWENLNIKKYGQILFHGQSININLKMRVNSDTMSMYFFNLKYERKGDKIYPSMILQPVTIMA